MAAGLSIAAMLCFVTGCLSTVSFTPVDYCALPVNPATTRMVIVRTNAGGGANVRIFDGDQPIGDLSSGGQLCWDRYPGESTISAAIHNTIIPNFSLDIDTKPDETYYMRIDFPTMGDRTLERIEQQK